MLLNSKSQPQTSQKDSNQSFGEPNTELNEKITQQQLDLERETEQINANNEWMAYVNGGPPKTPYLKSVGRLKKRPKVVHISSRQRRIFIDG